MVRIVNFAKPGAHIRTLIPSAWNEHRCHAPSEVVRRSAPPEEALTREHAIRVYYKQRPALILDDQIGSLEKGKQADLIDIDRNLLNCPDEEIKDTQELRTYLAGNLVHQRDE
jgi:predicted amidohydrolase YtcJ